MKRRMDFNKQAQLFQGRGIRKARKFYGFLLKLILTVFTFVYPRIISIMEMKQKDKQHQEG